MDSMIIIMFVAIIIVGLGLLIMMGITKRGGKVLSKESYQKSWLDIEQSVGSDDGSQQFAILQADKLLDKALKERGFRGETMGERMTSASREFTKREAVWAAHKLRNRIAHESSVRINSQLTRRALATFKKALKDLGAI